MRDNPAVLSMGHMLSHGGVYTAMIYRVTFRNRFNSEVEQTERPETFVHVREGVILSAVKAEVNPPPSLHVQEQLDEDDAFLAHGVETWDFEIEDGAEEEFIDALKMSRVVLDYQPLDDVIIR